MSKKVAEPPRPSRRWLLLSCLLGLVLLAWIIWFFTQPTTLPIKVIKVYHNAKYPTEVSIERSLAPYLQAGFFNVDLRSVQQALLTLPWVKNAEARKIWPDIVAVRIYAQEPLARWGKMALMNQQGELFMPNEPYSVSTQVPQFNAPYAQRQVVFAAYQRMRPLFATLKLHVTAIDVSSRLSWQITLSNGIKVIIGRQRIWYRLTRFVEVYDQIVGKHVPQIRLIDLRYANGLAVQEKNNTIGK